MPAAAQKRENVIKRSRDIQKLSKQVRLGAAHVQRPAPPRLPSRRPRKTASARLHAHPLSAIVPPPPPPCRQAIFSLHRGASEEADQRLAAAKKAAEELLPVIGGAPTLRQGSYSNASEARGGSGSL